MREGTEKHKGRKDREWYDTRAGRRKGKIRKQGRRMRSIGRNRRAPACSNDQNTWEWDEWSGRRVKRKRKGGRGGGGGREKRRDSLAGGAWKLEKSIWLWWNATRQVSHVPHPLRVSAHYFALFCLYVSLPPRVSFSLVPPRSLSLSRCVPLIRRNFHRKFSRAAGGSGARRKCECSAVFISAPNEFAGRFAHAHAGSRRDATRCIRLASRSGENESLSSRLSRCGRKSVCAPARTGFSAFSPLASYLFFSASRLRRRELKG